MLQLLAAADSERTLKHAAALAGLTPGLDGLRLVASSNGLTTLLWLLLLLLLVFVRVLVPLLVLVGLLFWALTLMQLLFLSLVAGMGFTLELSNAAAELAMLTTLLGCGFSTGRDAAIRS